MARPSSLSRRAFLRRSLGVTGGALLGAACARRRERPNVLLITLDTTRADRLGCFGYHRSTSPALDELASQSVFYNRAVATSSWTLPAHASIFTGKFTSSHGARYDPEGPLRLTEAVEGPWDGYRARGLAPGETTLAKILRDARYVTGAVVGGPWLKRVFGLDTGFVDYDDSQISTINGRLASEVTSVALKWLEARKGDDFFLFLNYFDPHSPYSAPEPYTYTFFSGGNPSETGPSSQDLSDLYDAEILYMDHHIGRLLDGLERLGLYDGTLIVVTADHGELLGEHGMMGHGNSLYQEEIHVPLFVKYPRGEVGAETSGVAVQLVDILPLILARLDLPLPEGIQGGVPPEVGHPIMAEVYPLPFVSTEGDWRVLFDGDFKLAWNSKGRHRLFNLNVDGTEEKDLAAREAERVRRMEHLLTAYLGSLPRPVAGAPPVELDEETRRALESLGYIGRDRSAKR